MDKLLALGDCNTLGVGPSARTAYPERFAAAIGLEPINTGLTMATTREAVRVFEDTYDEHCRVVTISYGLADSWKSLSKAPYVLYYPDSPLRKIARKLAKYYKKVGKKIGLTKIFGFDHVVPPQEYHDNVASIVSRATHSLVFLLEIPPHQEEFRNPWVRQYNAELAKVADAYDHCRLVRLYDHFAPDVKRYNCDRSHLTSEAYDDVTRFLLEAYHEAVAQRDGHVPAEEAASPAPDEAVQTTAAS